MPRALPYLLLLPATLFPCVFFLYPFVLVAADSFTCDGQWSLANYDRMASHWKFPTAFWNTMMLAALVVPIQLAMALTMASIVTRLDRGRSTILYIFAIPLGISDLAAGLIWLAVFEQSGFLNSMLTGFGVLDRPVLFLSYQNTWAILIAIVLAEVWRATAIMMVIIAAGMGLIPKEYGEVAEVFGASRWQRFRRVTLPMLKPGLKTALILCVILAFEVFAVVVEGGTQFPVLAASNTTTIYVTRDQVEAMSMADRIAFAIRPEDVAPADHGLTATVRVVEPLGPHTLVTTEVHGALFRAVLDSNLMPNPGDRLTLAPVRIRWFDPETQKALT